MKGLIKAIREHDHPHNRDSKRNFKREKDKHHHTEELEQSVQHSDPSRLPRYTQTDAHMLEEQGLEICPYMRNVNIDRERLLVYGSCAIPTDYVPGQDPNTCKPGGSYCPRHRVEQRDQHQCWHYMLLWGKRDLKPETESS